MWKQLYKKSPSPGSQKNIYILVAFLGNKSIFFSFYHAYKVYADNFFLFFLWTTYKDSDIEFRSIWARNKKEEKAGEKCEENCEWNDWLETEKHGRKIGVI